MAARNMLQRLAGAGNGDAGREGAAARRRMDNALAMTDDEDVEMNDDREGDMDPGGDDDRAAGMRERRARQRGNAGRPVPNRPPDGSPANRTNTPRDRFARLQAIVDRLDDDGRAWLRALPVPPDFSRPQAPYDPMPVLERHQLRTSGQVVDHYLDRLLNVTLPDDRRALLVQSLESNGAGFNPQAPDARRRIQGMIHLIMSMPEYQLN
jgi:hypothetical protein